MIEGETRGDAESPLRWICKSTRAISGALCRQKHPISHATVAQLLHALEPVFYSFEVVLTRFTLLEFAKSGKCSATFSV